MRQLKRQLLPLLLSVVFGVLALQPVSNIQAQSTPEDEPPFIYGGLAWSPDGEMIAVGTSEGVWFHDAVNLTPISQLSAQRFVTSLDWSSDGNMLISVSNDIQIWDMATRQALLNTDGQETIFTSVMWSLDDSKFATVTFNGIIQIWDTETTELSIQIQLSAGRRRYALTWSPDGQEIATFVGGNVEGQIVIYNIENGELSQSWFHDREIADIGWSPNSEIIVAGGSDGHIRMWNAETGELQYTLDADPYNVTALEWSPDGRRLASVGQYSSLRGSGLTRIWDMTTAHIIIEFQGATIAGGAYYTNALAWSPDGSRLASVSDDGKIYLWDMETYEPIAVYEGYRSILRSD